MSGLYAEFKTDAKLEQEGILYTCNAGDGKPMFRVRLARAGGKNKRYEQAREKITEPYRRLKNLTDEMQEQIALDTFAQGVVVKGSWETFDREKDEFVPGIETLDGVKPATAEQIVEVLKDLNDLYRTLMLEAMNMDNYRAVALEQDAKN